MVGWKFFGFGFSLSELISLNVKKMHCNVPLLQLNKMDSDYLLFEDFIAIYVDLFYG